MVSSSLHNNGSTLRKTVLATAISLSIVNTSSAATINVGGALGPTCGLIDAITSANTNASVGTCTAGSAGGIDTLVLQPSSIHSLTVVNSTATVNGAGVNGLPLIVSDISIEGNGATITRDIAAPGFRLFYVNNSSLSLTSMTLSNGDVSAAGTGNKANGGAIFSFGTLTLDHLTVTGNSAIIGGGIDIIGGELTMSNSTVSGNGASTAGGGLRLAVGGVIPSNISNSTISDNTANSGGGVWGSAQSLTLSNSTVSGNGANGGGAIKLNSSVLNLVNSTIADNRNSLEADSGSTVNINNSVIGDSRDNDDDCTIVGATFNDNGNNWFETSSCGRPGDDDALLRALESNGGVTQTHGVYAGSGLIDAGDNTVCSDPPINDFDQRGQSRPVGAACDIGAFEAVAPPIKMSIIVGPSCTLINAINSANSDTAVSGCIAGQRDDTIVLSANSVHSLSAIDNTVQGINGLPVINSTITIQGNGSTITSTRAQPFRFFYLPSNGNLTLEDITLSNASGTAGGGAIYNFGPVTLNRVTLQNNIGNLGGGIHARGATNINSSSILQNTATTSGGGVRLNSVAVTINNSTIANNESPFGGGIYTQTGSLDLNNSTVSGNSAGSDGGAIRNSGTAITVINSTITDNNSAATAGIRSFSGVVLFSNSILANNVAEPDCLGTITDVGSNWFGDASCNTIASGDPNLGSLTHNGGFTFTHNPNADSLVIDAGDDAICAALPIDNLDQRGELRPVGDHCDIGSIEYKDDGSFIIIPIGSGKVVVVPL